MNFVDRLNELMNNRGISKYRLAKDLQVQPSVVGRWVSGENLPSLEKSIQIADYFNVSTDYLLGRDDGHAVVKDNKTDDPFGELTDEERIELTNYLNYLRSKK